MVDHLYGSQHLLGACLCRPAGLVATLQGFPHWQVVVVDLRCHGESAAAAGGQAAVGPHTVESSARDVLHLLRELRMFPNMLVGHSFGGKVVMSMAHQFASRLPRPVQVGRAEACVTAPA